MPLLLRKIRKPKWHNNPQVTWLTQGSLQADALGDLKTNDNKLSVWHIEDDRSNLDEVLTALATSFDNASNLDYALLDLRLLSQMNVKVEYTQGDTLCEKANTRWHRDIAELTAQKLLGLAKTILRDGTKQRLPETRVVCLVRDAASSGIVDRDKLRPGLRAKVGN